MKFVISLIQGQFIETIALISSIVGGCIGLTQWKKGNDYKRAALARKLINQIRDDKEISAVVDMIDWSDGIEYDGEFHFVNEARKESFLSDESQLFLAIDRTLAHFNYICYLKRLHIFYDQDMNLFDYTLRRLFDNEDICNYLHSLSLWSESLDVLCSYEHLIQYGKKKSYIDKSFGKKYSKKYKCFLEVIDK